MCHFVYPLWQTAPLLDETEQGGPEQVPSPNTSIESLLQSMSILGHPSEEDRPPQIKQSLVRPTSQCHNLVYRTAFTSVEPVTSIEPRNMIEHELASSTDTASTISSCSVGLVRPPTPCQRTLDDGRNRCYDYGRISGYEDVEDRHSLYASQHRSAGGHCLEVNSERRKAMRRSLSLESVTDFASKVATSEPKEALVRSTASLDARGFLTLRQIKRERDQRRGKESCHVGVQCELGGHVNLGFGSNGSMDCDLRRRADLLGSTDTLSYTTAATHLSVASTSSFASVSDGGVACLSYTRNGSSCESVPVAIETGCRSKPRTAGPFYASVTSLRDRSGKLGMPAVLKHLVLEGLQRSW